MFTSSNKFIKYLQLNFGPQHPAAHGVLRGILYIQNEIIKHIEVHIGLLHRGSEKLIEQKNLIQAMPYFDRLDYVSMLAQEHTFILTSEKLFGIKINSVESYSRILLLEVTRILNHLMGLTTHAIDIGAFTPFLWGFEDREKLMEFYEQISGARMHAALFLPGKSRNKISSVTLLNMISFISKFVERLNEMSELLSVNPIWIMRLKNIGTISHKEVLSYGFSGPIARSSGLKIDIRNDFPYEKYNKINFKIPISSNNLFSDSLDRYHIRFLEMYESSWIIQNVASLLLKESCNSIEKKTETMETVIAHFKKFSRSEQWDVTSKAYLMTETPKGELGCYLNINRNKIMRCYIKASGFSHVNYLNLFNKESFVSDLVTTIGSADLVFGEIDR